MKTSVHKSFDENETSYSPLSLIKTSIMPQCSNHLAKVNIIKLYFKHLIKSTKRAIVYCIAHNRLRFLIMYIIIISIPNNLIHNLTRQIPMIDHNINYQDKK